MILRFEETNFLAFNTLMKLFQFFDLVITMNSKFLATVVFGGVVFCIDVTAGKIIFHVAIS